MEISLKVKTSRLTYVIFTFTVIIVLINYASLFFPSLIPAIASGYEIEANVFEQGIWLIPVLLLNLFLLGFAIAYYKKILPKIIRNSFNFILDFEVSKNVGMIVVIVILFGFTGWAMGDIVNYEGDTWGDFPNIENIANAWPFNKGDQPTIELLHVKNFFLKSSIVLFDNIKVFPLMATLALLFLTYFFTAKLTQKRFAGIVAMLVLTQSYSFQLFDSMATYANFWGLFYLLSLYLVYKKWYLSPISYIASLFAKPLTLTFLPMSIFFVYRADISRKRKIILVIPYFVIFGAVATIVLFPDLITTPFGGTSGGFDYTGFLSGLTTWAYQLRFDYLFLIFILPVTVGLLIKSRQGVTHADSIMFMIVGMIFAMPMMAGLTGWNLHPYRYIPLLVFFAIGVGMLLSKRAIPEAETQYKQT